MIDFSKPPSLSRQFPLVFQGETVSLNCFGDSTWTFPQGELSIGPNGGDDGWEISLYGPDFPLEKIRLRWEQTVPAGTRFLGDHWERAYGDLEWRGMVPEWLDLLSRSGTTLFVSLDPASLGRAAVQNTVAEPLDWLDTTYPGEWRFGDKRTGYNWFLDWR